MSARSEFHDALIAFAAQVETHDVDDMSRLPAWRELNLIFERLLDKASPRIKLAPEIADTPTGLEWRVGRLLLYTHDGVKLGHVERVSDASTNYRWQVNTWDLMKETSLGREPGSFTTALDECAEVATLLARGLSRRRELSNDVHALRQKWKATDGEKPEQPPSEATAPGEGAGPTEDGAGEPAPEGPAV